jgi:glycosyltransferase involved in cell wall biosynthesis
VTARARPIAIHLPGIGRDGLGGGAERVAVTLAGEFVRAGRPTDLVLSVAHPASSREVPPGVRIIDLNSRRLWTALPGLIAYRWRERPRVVLSIMPLANTLNVLSAAVAPRGARPTVLSEQNARSIALDHRFGAEGTRLLHPVCRLTYPSAGAVIGCSEGVAALVRAAYPSLGTRVVGIPNPVEASTGRTAVPPHPWLGDPKTPCLVGLGRLHEQKDHLTFLRTLERVRQVQSVRALLFGEGPMRSAVEAEVLRLGLEDHVRLLGYVPDPRRFLAWADLLLHTALWEGLPVVLLEALAEGVPVVSTDCPTGPREILDGGSFGFLAPTGDDEALANAVLATLKKPRDPSRLRARAQDFSPTVIARRYLNVIDQVSAP